MNHKSKAYKKYIFYPIIVIKSHVILNRPTFLIDIIAASADLIPVCREWKLKMYFPLHTLSRKKKHQNALRMCCCLTINQKPKITTVKKKLKIRKVKKEQSTEQFKISKIKNQALSKSRTETSPPPKKTDIVLLTFFDSECFETCKKLNSNTNDRF